MSRRRLIVMLKAPRAGLVKTRLAATIGAEAAGAAYQVLLDHLLGNLAKIPAVELRHTPEDSGPELAPWLRTGWTLAPQGDGDLGQRLTRAFAAAFAQGNERVVVIGSDCPEILEADIHDAWERLEGNDAVVGPATDGGYWLIGLRAPCPQLFQGIPWSTSEVLRSTLRQASHAGLRVSQLRLLTDIDDEGDWNSFRHRGKAPN